MNRIFEDLNKTSKCKNDMSNCVKIESSNFDKYPEGSDFSLCGAGNSVYNIISVDNFLVYSTKLSQYTITFDFIKPVTVFGYMLEMRENPSGTGCYWSYPDKWTFEAFDEHNNHWEVIDDQNGDYLKSRKKLISFDFPISYKFRKFKLNVEHIDTIQNGIWSSISRFEMIGFSNKPHSCNNNQTSNNMISLLYIFIILK